MGKEELFILILILVAIILGFAMYYWVSSTPATDLSLDLKPANQNKIADKPDALEKDTTAEIIKSIDETAITDIDKEFEQVDAEINQL